LHLSFSDLGFDSSFGFLEGLDDVVELVSAGSLNVGEFSLVVFEVSQASYSSGFLVNQSSESRFILNNTVWNVHRFAESG